MLINVVKIALIFLLCVVSYTTICAQADASSPTGRPTASKENDFPEGFKEGLAKRRIKAEEKEYEELIQRGEEAVKISDELNKNFEANKNITAEDTKRIDRLEKVVKKIRADLGAQDEDSFEQNEKLNKPSSLENVLSNIKETTSDLLSELKKTTRHSISVVAIQSSNSLLKLVKFVRFNKK